MKGSVFTDLDAWTLSLARGLNREIEPARRSK
jgi:hypothetical protein